MACSLCSQRAKSRSPRRKIHVLLPALCGNNTQAESWAVEKIEVSSPQWQAFMRGSMQTALSTGQEAHLEAEAIATDIAALVDVIAELSKDAVAYLHALDPTGAFSLSSAAPSKHAVRA